MYTAYYDPGRCFEETRSGAFTVTVAGAWFPRNILGRANALCAYLRCILVALHIAWLSRKPGSGYDVIIADQVSAVVPVLKALTSARVLFYCHFPDMLLSKPSSALHALYRLPLDWVEQTTTGMADRVLVNSDYTRGIFEETFARLSRRRVVPDVLYPAVVLPSDAQLAQTQAAWRGVLPAHVVELIDCGPVFVSINRFERKKGIAMAVEALHQLSSQAAANTEARQPGLIIAGGFDSRLPENVEHLRELGQLAMRLGVRERVAFLPSFADAVRPALLAAAVAVLYTPMGEHFGIVPLEAMAAGTPVVACNSGGPMESVVNGQTGFLCSPTPEDFAGAMAKLLVRRLREGSGLLVCLV